MEERKILNKLNIEINTKNELERFPGRNILTIIILCLGEILYFWEIIFGGKTLGTGSDGLLINLMLEHWHDVFRGELTFETLRMYYPQTGTLGYSDMLLGPGVIFSIIREFGGDFFRAMNVSMIILHCIGVLFLYLSLRKLGCSRKVGILGILLSFWSCSFSQLTWHLQFFSLSFISMVLFGIVSWGKQRDRSIGCRLFYIGIATIGIGGAALSSFYTTYLTCLLAGITVLLWGTHYIIQRKTDFWKMIKKGSRYRWDFLGGMLFQIPWLILLLRVYLPSLKELGNYNPEESLCLAPSPMDLIRTMSYTPLESLVRSVLPFRLPDQIDETYRILAKNAWFERSYGWPVITVVLFCVFMIYMHISKRGKEKEVLVFCYFMAITMSALFLMGSRYGNFSPWTHILRYFVPGAGAIRATGRCLGIFVIPLAVCICCWLSRMEQGMEPSRNRLLIFEIALMGILGVTAISKRYMRDDTEYYRQIINECSQPPEDCKIIMIYSVSPDAVYEPEIQLITWLLADHFNLYTINGYTGNYPVNWKLAYKGQKAYLELVDYWLDCQEVMDRTNIYAYVPEANIWIPYNDLHEFAIINHIY